MSPRLTCLLAAASLIACTCLGNAEPAVLYLLNGTVLRGEIVDRSGKNIQLRTPSGLIKVKTASLMPISRQQLKLPAEAEKGVTTPEMEALLSQMEKIIAENESLKAQLDLLKGQIKQTIRKSPQPLSPAEGPTANR